MTFTLQVKDEISKEPLNEIENRYLLLGYIFLNAEMTDKYVTISLENLSVARKLFKTLKYCYKLEPRITVRMQKKFRVQKIYIFEIHDTKNILMGELKNLNLEDRESSISFIKGIFLAAGSINDPKKSRYHLEMNISNKKQADFVTYLLSNLGLHFKQIIRNKTYMIYLKSSEEISDFLKLINTVNSLFYFEDIRIYRDHKNMVNRLNNCEQANYEKSLKTSDEQLNKIRFLKDNHYFNLLDEKTRLVADIRLKYPEESYQALADILSSEIMKPVTKSYINHHFRKINEIYNKITNVVENDTKEQ